VRGIDRDVYAASLVASAVASILFISVAAEHRLRWRQGEKADIVDVSHRAMIWGLGFLALGMSGAIFVVLRAVLGDAQGAVIAVATLTAFGWFWFCLPLIRRSSRAPRPRRSGGHPARGGDGAPRGATMRARRESPVSSEHEEPLVIDVQNGS
jgi:hypothetical protein